MPGGIIEGFQTESPVYLLLLKGKQLTAFYRHRRLYE
jgi:hypothetical protein